MVILALPVSLYFLLKNPFVQTFLAQSAANYLSGELHTEIKIGRVKISNFFDIVLSDVLVKDLHDNTILSVENLSLNIQKLKIKDNIIKVNKLILEKSEIGLIKYKGDSTMNFNFIIDYFDSGKSSEVIDTSEKKDWKIQCNVLKIIDSRFKYQNQDRVKSHEGINFTDLDISGLNLDFRNIEIISDTIWVKINNLSLQDTSGFKIRKLKGDLKVNSQLIQADHLKIITNNSELSLKLAFTYKSFENFNDFLTNVKIKTTIGTSALNLCDIGYFAPELFVMNNIIKISGDIKGTVSNFRAKNFKFYYGDKTKFIGNIDLNGLPDIKETFVHARVKDFAINKNDIESFLIPGKENHLNMPDELLAFGNIKIKGTFTGFYNDFVSNAEFSTDIGEFSTDVLLKDNKQTDTVEYQGKITANNFDMGKFLNISDYFGKLNLNIDIKGRGLTAESAVIDLNGVVDSLDFKGNNYNEIDIKGELADKKFSGHLNVLDDNINLNFEGMVDFSEELPVFDFSSQIRNAKLYQLNLLDRDSTIVLSTNLNINFVGNNLDDIQGKILIDSTFYYEKNKKYYLDHFALVIIVDTNNHKNIQLHSDIIDVDLKGDFLFTELYPSFKKLFSNYIDVYYNDAKDIPEDSLTQSFDFQVNLKNTANVSELFYPDLLVIPNTEISGSYNSSQNFLAINGNSSLITYKGIKFENWFIECKSKNDDIFIKTGSKNILFKESNETDSISLGVENTVFSTNIHRDSIIYNISWNDTSANDRNTGNINGYVHFINSKRIDAKIVNAKMIINDTVWKISEDNFIEIDTSSITVNDFEVMGGDRQKFEIDGIISKLPTDTFNLKFKNWDFSNFDILVGNDNLDFDGIINGELSLVNLYNSPNFFSNIKIDDFVFNDEKLGNAKLKTNWNYQQNSLYTNIEIINVGNIGKSKTLSLNGYYYPTKDSNNLDFEIFLQNFKLRAVDPFISGFISNLKGIASGNFKLSGSTSKPDLTGKLKLMRTEFKIDYLNVVYSLANKIDFNKNEIVFNDMVLYDSLGNQAICTGRITHENLKNFKFNINIKPKDFACLNTDSYLNSEFYGQANISGDIKINGPLNKLMLNITVTTNKGTNINIPISTTADVSEQNYIIFINKSDTALEKPIYNVNTSGVTINFKLNITPDAKIQLFLPSQMGTIKADGNGNINLSINPQGYFRIVGDYVIKKGVFHFTMQNLVNKRFSIIEGGKISWTGSPYDAEVDLKALYKVKTSLNGLGPQMDSTVNYGRRVYVDCILGLKGKLFDPDIHFSILLPNVDEATRQMVYSVLDTTNEAEMNQQMLSLLVLGSFSYNTTATPSLEASSYKLISNQLSNWLSQISKDFDIGINYIPGNQVSDEELEVALSTQLFNDRVSIDGSFGVTGEKTADNASNIVGDVNVEVKLTEDGRFRVRAFNRSNVNSAYDIYSYDQSSPYTQGVGIFYRKEFNSFAEIFQRQKKKKPKKKKND
ncbi:MAG: translocation/assembly module TamB [Bacteroidetes bacterium]|nr:translocation/assembly module TamB [Bacteroidota bacterium]